jgi:hypothetical protein
MPPVTFDTSVFIAYKPAALPAGFRMSVVVIQELTAGALDKSEVQYWNASRLRHEKGRNSSCAHRRGLVDCWQGT